MFSNFKKRSAALRPALWLLAAPLAHGAITPPGNNSVFSFTQNGVVGSYSLSADEIMRVDAIGQQTLTRLETPLAPDALIQQSRQLQVGATYPIFYPLGKEGRDGERLVMRDRLMVVLAPGATIEQVSSRLGAVSSKPIPGSEGYYVLSFGTAAAALDMVQATAQDPGVSSVEPLFGREVQTHAIPTDPLFAKIASRTYYQWNLKNTGHPGGVAGIDAKLEAAWDLRKGVGINIAVVDEGLETTHPDLTGNIAAATIPGHNWNAGDPNTVTPLADTEVHGTQVAGVIAAMATFTASTTTILGAGVAPSAKLVGLRLVAGSPDNSDVAEAMLWQSSAIQIYNNSWGFAGFDPTLKAVPPVIRTAIQQGVATGRANKGNIYVFTAGNNAAFNDNANYNGINSMPEVITVGAVDDAGKKAFYSEPGANLLVSAPSGGGTLDIVTTNYRGAPQDDGNGGVIFPNPNFVSNFSGTSAAGATVSGVVALMLEANTNLGWRDVQEILLKTATKVSPDDADWITNAAGFNFNHQFGAGLVNATEAVKAATALAANVLPARVKQSKYTLNITPIPDNTGNSFLLPIDFSDQPNLRVEQVEVVLTAIHARRADLEVALISPNGTQSLLTTTHTNNTEQSISDYSFSTVRNWGEGSKGQWVLRITDRRSDATGFFNGVGINIYGTTNAAAPVSQKPILLSNRLVKGVQNTALSYKVEQIGATSVTIDTALPAGLSFNSATNTITGTPTAPGVTSSKVTLTGAGGSTTLNLNFLIDPVAAALGQAIEQDGAAVTTTGDVKWGFEFTNVSPNPLGGGDSASSGGGGDLLDNQYSQIGFTVQLDDQAVALFDWKTSSEAGTPAQAATPNTPAIAGKTGDRLYFSLGGTAPGSWNAFIGGDTPWATTAVLLNKGSNALAWRYQKDASNASFEDRGFLDYVRFVPWATYSADLMAAAGSNLPFEFPSKTVWQAVDDTTATGGRAIRSSAIGDGQASQAQLTVKGPGLLKFKWKNIAADGDGMTLLINGLPYRQISGNASTWTAVEQEIPAGNITIVWEYMKDASGSGTTDAGFLDDVDYQRNLTYALWAADNFTPAEISNGTSAGTADTDKDGISNFMEYAWGTNPRVANPPSSRLPAIASNATNLTITFTADTNLKDLTYALKSSTDLTTWADETAAVLSTSKNLTTYQLQVAKPLVDPKRFYRADVQQSP